MKPFVVGTRFYESKIENGSVALAKLRKFVNAARAAGAERVLVAVNTAEDKSGAMDADWSEGTSVFGVTPWGKFVQPLNALMLTARQELADGSGLLLASVEVILTAQIVETLQGGMGDDTAVVGAAMLGHNFVAGYHGPADGRKVPWNTLAIWNPQYLYPTGFPTIGDGIPENINTAGVEELATLAVIQALHPNAKAKMIVVDGVSWDTSDFDADRLAKHEGKMASKVTRPAQQLAWANLPTPTVAHV